MIHKELHDKPNKMLTPHYSMSKILFTVSVLSGLTSFALYNLGFALEKKVIQKLPDEVKSKTKSMLKAILANPLWLLGLFLTMVSVGLYFVALMWAPLSTIAPLAGFGLVVLVIFAHVDLKESLKKIEILSFILIVVGICVSSYLTSTEEITYTWDIWTTRAHSFGGILFLCLTVIIGLSFLSFRTTRMKKITSYSIAFFAGSLAGIQAIMVKGATVWISNKTYDQNLLVFLSFIFAILMTALFSTGSLQFSFKEGKVSIVMSIYNGIMTVFPILFGGIILQEWSSLQLVSKIFLGISIFITLVGIVILSIKHSHTLQDNNL